MFRSEARAEIDKARAAAKAAYKRELRAVEAARAERTYTPREASVAAQARRAGVPLRTFWRRLKEGRQTASDDPVGTVSDPSVGTVSDPACVLHTQPYPHAPRRHKHSPPKDHHLPDHDHHPGGLDMLVGDDLMKLSIPACLPALSRLRHRKAWSG
jgi:hypothetical protein